MKQKGYNNLTSFRGLVAKNEENTAAFERVQFMKKTTGNLNVRGLQLKKCDKFPAIGAHN